MLSLIMMAGFALLGVAGAARAIATTISDHNSETADEPVENPNS